MDLTIKNLSYSHSHDSRSQAHLFEIPDLKIQTGEHVLIKGPSGSGKSTFLNCLSGILSPTSGSIAYAQKDLTRLLPAEIQTFRKNHIAYVFQNFSLIEYLTPLENTLLNPSGTPEEARQILHLLGLEKQSSKQVRYLSMGERQRVAIARALTGTQSVVLADELTSSLDKHATSNVMTLLKSLKKEATIICVSHDERIESFFDRILNFEDFCS